MLHVPILIILACAIVPLALAVFYHVTEPSKHWYRVFSRVWLTTPIGIQTVAQKIILLALLSFITLSRFAPDLPGRQIIAYTLYALLVIAFWAFFIIQRRIQKPYEAADRAALKNHDNDKKEST